MLRRFLPSVVAHSGSAEVWVADNASTDDSLQVLASQFPMVKTLVLEKNWGFADGYNKALEQIDADYYVLLNSDVEVTADWLSPLVAYMDEHPDVAAVQPKLLSQTDKRMFEYAGAAGGFVDRFGYPYCRGRIFGVVEEDKGQYNEPMDIHWATGACMLVRANDYWNAGGLDGRFFAHNEEIDLCWRLRISGRRIVCLPCSTVYHVGGGTLPQGNPRKTYLNFRNNLTMLYKNLPQQHLRSVLRARLVLDYVAALQSLLKGNMGDVKAIIRARRDFKKWINDFNNDRIMIQTNRKLSSSEDVSTISVLWQFYAKGRKHWSALASIAVLVVALFSTLSAHADDKTRGIGVYPGRLSESFATAQVKSDQYRNLAANRMAFHSSSFDYNLTAQLATDGLIAQAPLCWLETRANGELVAMREREWPIDGNDWSNVLVTGSTADLLLKWNGMAIEADSVSVSYTVAYDEAVATRGYDVRLLDGDWQLARESVNGLPGRNEGRSMSSDPNKQADVNNSIPARRVEKGYKLHTKDGVIHSFCLHLNMPGAVYWRVAEVRFYHNGEILRNELLTSNCFQSAWRSAEGGNQWLYVDLGADASFDNICLFWLEFLPKGHLETSDDAQNWRHLADLPTDGPLASEVPVSGHGRYVRVVLEGSEVPYMLSEMQVFGKGGMTVAPHAEAPLCGNTLPLNGGDWRLQRSSEVQAPGEVISTTDFSTADWLVATVPGTVLTSYVNAGAVPDQNYDNNVFYTSESFFYSNFWYRREFVLPESFSGKVVHLNLDGINWKANVWLNGKKIGRVEGAFTRGNINLSASGALKAGHNVLAIEIEKVGHPGSVKEKYTVNTDYNGGILGADNPTFHATIGWDWINTVRGRDIGIWNDIMLTADEGVVLSDPLIMTHLNAEVPVAAATGNVTLTPRVFISSSAPTAVRGTLHGWVGDVSFDKDIEVKPGTNEIILDPSEFAQLQNQNLHLWWPNGYGEPYLYDAGFSFTTDKGEKIHEITFKQGIREMSYTDKMSKLRIYANGHRIVPFGGNWGFSEHNLNYRGREYDIAVRNHADMHFNMIRNWVGQTGDEEFYEACDKYGVMVWQDFWLANPADGPDPYDEPLFMRNAYDYVNRIRHHASIGLYCGRNEGKPTVTLNRDLIQLVADQHPDIEYIPDSAADGVSGHGPYRAIPVKEYFERQTGKLHSERGMPNVMTFEGLSRTLRPEHLWPQNTFWGQHDYTMEGAQRGATFNQLIAKYGDINSAEQFTSLAQFVNYDGYRGMYESASKERMGLLIWMSHACWPSMVWQCYDYYFEPTAAYFGCRKACEPLHIQYNASTGNVEVVNQGVGTHKNLRATVKVISLDGKVLSHYMKKVTSEDDSCLSLPAPEKPAGNDAYMLCLTLVEGRTIVSENRYLLTAEDGDFSALEKLPVVELKKTIAVNGTSAEVTLEAPSTAVMVRLNLKDANGEQILPVHYTDNYFHLFAGEKKVVRIDWSAEDQHTDTVTVDVTGYNVK